MQTFNEITFDIKDVNYVQREKSSYHEPVITVSLSNEEAFHSRNVNFAEKIASWLERKAYQVRQQMTYTCPLKEIQA